MHPSLTQAVSRLAYRRALHAHPCTRQRFLDGVDSGIHAREVSHTDRSVHSPEEITAVLALTRDLLGRACDDGTRQRELGVRDVLVVAPNNRQVDALTQALAAAGLPGVRAARSTGSRARKQPSSWSP